MFFSTNHSWAHTAVSLTQLLLLVHNPRTLTLRCPQGEGCGQQCAGGDLAQEVEWKQKGREKCSLCEKSAGGAGAAGTLALLFYCWHHSGVQSSACVGAVKMHRLPVSFQQFCTSLKLMECVSSSWRPFLSCEGWWALSFRHSTCKYLFKIKIVEACLNSSLFYTLPFLLPSKTWGECWKVTQKQADERNP